MRGNELLEKMELVAPYYVEAADIMPERQKKLLSRWTGIAACLAVIMFAGCGLWLYVSSDEQTKLPMLSVSEIMGEGQGSVGLMAYDISELVSANPWNEESTVNELPVFKNPLTYDEIYYTATGADPDKMNDLILTVADSLGLDATPEVHIKPSRLTMEQNGISIEVDHNMTATIRFEPALSIPSEYNFTYHASYEDTYAVAEYLKTEYSGLIGIENPQINIYGGDYNIYGQQGFDIGFYDAGGSETEQIINYNFNQVVFSCNDDGKLFIVRVFKPDLSQQVGVYPIISTDDAYKLLMAGEYLTSCPYEVSEAEYVKKVELVYGTGNYDEYFMPYYCFYVENPEMEDNGLKTYGTFYVPAVSGKYIR